MPKNVIIVGAPRSGTSMTASIFKNKGYFITDDELKELQEANEFNPNGFWESAGLRKCNAEIYNRVEYSFENTWMFNSISERQARAINALEPESKHIQFVKKYNSKQPWMWKDPNLCYTIGYWWPLIDRDTTRIILLRRNKEEIYKSFVRLQWCSNKKSEKNNIVRKISHHIDFAENTLCSHNIPYLSLDYSDFEQDIQVTADKISKYCNINISIEDLGYDKRLNTSHYRHLVFIDRLGNIMPSKLRKAIKNLIPRKILKRLFPTRNPDSL